MQCRRHRGGLRDVGRLATMSPRAIATSVSLAVLACGGRGVDGSPSPVAVDAGVDPRPIRPVRSGDACYAIADGAVCDRTAGCGFRFPASSWDVAPPGAKPRCLASPGEGSTRGCERDADCFRGERCLEWWNIYANEYYNSSGWITDRAGSSLECTPESRSQ